MTMSMRGSIIETDESRGSIIVGKPLPRGRRKVYEDGGSEDEDGTPEAKDENEEAEEEEFEDDEVEDDGYDEDVGAFLEEHADHSKQEEEEPADETPEEKKQRILWKDAWNAADATARIIVEIYLTSGSDCFCTELIR